MCRGRGEIVTPLRPLAPGRALTLVLSNLRSGTREAYAGLKLPAPGAARRADALVEAMAAGDDAALADAAFNRFEETVFAAIPPLGELHRAIGAIAGARPRLSGSGSGLWFVGDAARAEESLAGDADWREQARRHALRIERCLPRV